MTTGPRFSGRTPSRPPLLWMLLAGATAGWGVLAAVVSLPWQALVAVAVAAGLLGGSLALSGDAVTSDDIDLGRAGVRGALTGLAALVLVGLASAAGLLGVSLLVVVLLTWPGLPARARAALAQLRERRAAETPASERSRTESRDDAWNRIVPGSVATEPDLGIAGVRYADAAPDNAPDWSPTLVVPAHLSDHDLCLAWESSSRALRRCTSTAARLEVVRERQACLDELERRRPEALRAWVLSGADADSSPEPYLTR